MPEPDLSTLLLQQGADMIDPERDREEAGHDERIGNKVLIVDVQFSAEEADKNNNGKHQKGKDSFHFCDFTGWSFKFLLAGDR
jgi:hypothetical protein